MTPTQASILALQLRFERQKSIADAVSNVMWPGVSRPTPALAGFLSNPTPQAPVYPSLRRRCRYCASVLKPYGSDRCKNCGAPE